MYSAAYPSADTPVDSDPAIDYAAIERVANSKNPGVGLRRSLATLSAPYQAGHDWFAVREGAISFLPARSKKGAKGPRSMVNMCLRVLADNIGAVPSSAIRDIGIPNRIRWALWKELAPRQAHVHPFFVSCH